MPIDATPPGDPAPSTPAKTPPHTPIPGNLVTLEPISPAHSPSLFKHLGGPANAPLWTYLFHHAPATQAEMDTMVAEWVPAPDGPPPEFQMYAVMPRAESSSGADVQQQPEALGVVAYLNNVPAHRRIEVGFIALGTRLQRTRAATEALYLLIQRPFDDELGYRRVEWKANSRNAPSLAAAERLGFVYEGVFRFVQPSMFALSPANWSENT